MVEIVSALADKLVPGRHGVARDSTGLTLREIVGRDLVQVAWWPASDAQVKVALGRELGFAIDQAPRRAAERGQTTAFPVAPEKLWIAAPEIARLGRRLGAAVETSRGAVTELGHAHTVLRLTGPSAREVLARHLAIDLDPGVFVDNSFALTAMHKTRVLLHAARDMAGAEMLDLYLPRSFAASLFDRLCGTAERFGYTIVA